jgi:serine kinase of HPr protein (carbohydrate metabolism regulator)
LRRRLGSAVREDRKELSETCQPARTGAVELRSRGIYDVESRYQATSGEDSAEQEDLVIAVVNYKVCESEIVL